MQKTYIKGGKEENVEDNTGDDRVEETDEELDELEQRLIPDEGEVRDARSEVKHKLEISQQLFENNEEFSNECGNQNNSCQ